MSLLCRYDILSKRLKEIDGLLRSNDADTEAEVIPSPGNVSVVIGTSDLAAKHLNLADRITKMITDAYGAVGVGHPRLLQEQPVSDRLKMGDGSDRGDGVLNTNRVLHIAFIGDTPVGCVSSSCTTTWVSGIGHWGLLVVDPDMQGKGIASSLVASAERRVAEHGCNWIQLEYEFLPGNVHSQRLEKMYSKWGYKQVFQFPLPEGGEFRIIGKTIPEPQQKRGQRIGLLAERAQIIKLLGQLQAPPASVDMRPMRSKDFFDALAAFVKAKGTEVSKDIKMVFHLTVTDAAGSDGKFVLDLKGDTGDAGTGKDSDADVHIMMSDNDMVAWWKKSMDWKNAFWGGRVSMKGPPPTGGPETFWAAYVEKLTGLFDEVWKYAPDQKASVTTSRIGLLTAVTMTTATRAIMAAAMAAAIVAAIRAGSRRCRW